MFFDEENKLCSIAGKFAEPSICYDHIKEKFFEAKPIFERNIDSLFSWMEIVIPGKNIPKKYNDILQAARACKGLVTINRIALKCKMSETDIVEILWEMAQKGFLRIIQ